MRFRHALAGKRAKKIHSRKQQAGNPARSKKFASKGKKFFHIALQPERRAHPATREFPAAQARCLLFVATPTCRLWEHPSLLSFNSTKASILASLVFQADVPSSACPSYHRTVPPVSFSYTDDASNLNEYMAATSHRNTQCIPQDKCGSGQHTQPRVSDALPAAISIPLGAHLSRTCRLVCACRSKIR